MLVDRPNVLERQRLKVEAVAGVVISRDGLGIAVDHDRLVSVVVQRERSVAAAVVKLNSLPDAVGPAAQDDDFLLLGRRGLVLVFVGRVKIRREAFKLRRAGVDALVDRQHAVLLPEMPNFLLSLQPPGRRQPPVGEAHAFRLAQHLGRNRLHGMLLQLKLLIVDLFELVEEPGIHRGHLRNLLHRVSLPQRVLHVSQALRMRRHQTLGQNLRLDLAAADALARIERADALHQRLFKGASDGHDFANGLHLRPQVFIRSGKFLKLPLRNLDHHVVERRLEARRSLARDVVRDFIERVAHGELCRNLRDGKSRGLRSQRRGSRNTRVHFDDHHAPGLWIHAELNV